jgi:secondary thiamine-phosphate synthase enzyme
MCVHYRAGAISWGMRQAVTSFEVKTRRGLTDVTDRVQEIVRTEGIATGLCTIFIRHTSASLVIQENADPKARRDLERFLDRLVPDGDPLYEHTTEGDDDMPSHVKSALTHTSEQIPIRGGALALGTWQGLYVWEHRDAPHRRELVVHVIGD